MDIITYKMAQKYADKVAAGFSSVRVDGLDIIFTLNDGKTATVTVPAPKDGVDGQDGNGILSIEKTGTEGLVDTYTIYFTNGTTTIFTVTNGSGESGGITNYEELTNKVTSLSSSSTDIQYPSAKCVYDLIGNIESLLSEV